MGDVTETQSPKMTLATKAVDELYVLIVSFCHLIEIFFQPFYPTEVTYDLHTDLMVLSQHLLFKRQEEGRIYECLTVLMRVDSQIDDKDLREKMRLCADYSPLDLGVDPDFAMMPLPKSEQLSVSRPVTILDMAMVSINQSNVKLGQSSDQAAQPNHQLKSEE